MARELDIDFNIVWGKLERLNEHVLGNLVINVNKRDKQRVLDYVSKSGVLWEVA
ncbi:MAG: NIL domain-containing protein [Campylobacter sp.]